MTSPPTGAAFGLCALRARAQARVAALPEAEQRTLLTSPPSPDPTDARAIADAVEALLRDAATS